MRAFIKYNLAYLGAIMVASSLFLCSCDAEITRCLEAPKWIEAERVSSDVVDLHWASVEDAVEYVVYFGNWGWPATNYLEPYRSRYEIARTKEPAYRYQWEAQSSPSYYQYWEFAVSAVDKNGNMSRARTVDVPPMR